MKPDANLPQMSDQADALEAFLAPARAPGALSEDLFARIMRDAAQVSSAQMAPAIAAPAPRQSGLGWLIAALGGWPMLGGMASAAIAGLWLGFTSPALLDPSGLTANAYTISDLMPSFELAMADLDWTE